jgi:hypothetical protein
MDGSTTGCAVRKADRRNAGRCLPAPGSSLVALALAVSAALAVGRPVSAQDVAPPPPPPGPRPALIQIGRAHV